MITWWPQAHDVTEWRFKRLYNHFDLAYRNNMINHNITNPTGINLWSWLHIASVEQVLVPSKGRLISPSQRLVLQNFQTRLRKKKDAANSTWCNTIFYLLTWLWHCLEWSDLVINVAGEKYAKVSRSVSTWCESRIAVCEVWKCTVAWFSAVEIPVMTLAYC